MQITGKLLLNSAEGILKDRKQENSEIKNSKSSDQSSKTVSSAGIGQTTIESRLLDLQNSISEIQNQYSREQTRYSYLTESPDEINENLKFNEKPLFPEYNQEFNPENAKIYVAKSMTELMQNLKKIQIEMENIHALKFKMNEDPASQAAFHVNQDAVKHLDPERVARLTR
ncbi:MAG: hypothetical protein OEZ34_13190 [Spirochaetia bacterium]|nr:hypothetical protein [Spirochaetia bacterium]